MADYVKNTLIVNKKLANRILIKEQDSYRFDFNSINKIPDKLTNEQKYNWIIKNWGTTSNAMDSVVTFDEVNNIFIINFLTSWAPPRWIIEKLEEISGDENYIWISINEVNDFLTRWTKDRTGRLVKVEMHHNLDFYDDNVFQSMIDFCDDIDIPKKL